jgi:dTDP-4-dehydrorhamnose reductase
MRILIFGGDGMLGHRLARSWEPRHEVTVTLSRDSSAYAAVDALLARRRLYQVDVRQLGDVLDAVRRARPELVVNAAGIVKQRPTAEDAIRSIEVNALFPHRLAQVCGAAGSRLVHLSTDCVFSGKKGRYTEADPPDPKELYGRTKLLGEVVEPHCLTLRTSIIGLELCRNTGLIEWFVAQRGQVRGFRRAIYTGLTTAEMARAIEHLAGEGQHGLWHLASSPIDKYTLLAGLLRRLGRRDVQIVPDDGFECDRSLDGSALAARSSYKVPSWEAMLDELAADIRMRENS